MIEEVASVLGSFGLLFGAYQYHERRKDKKRSERLEEAADHLSKLKSNLDDTLMFKFSDEIHIESDISYLRLSRSILAFMYLGETPIEVQTTIQTWTPEDWDEVTAPESPLQFEDVEDADILIERMKDEESRVYVKNTIEGPKRGVPGFSGPGFDSYLSDMRGMYSSLNEGKEEHLDIILEFDPDLISDIENVLNNIVKSSVKLLYRNDGVRVITSEYCNDIDSDIELANRLYKDILVYDRMKEDKKELEEIAERIEEVRRAMIQARYS